MTPTLQAIIASTLSSVLGLGGGVLLLWNYQAVKRGARLFVSFAAGALLGAVFFDILTDAIQEHPQEITYLFSWVVGGFLLFFLIEKALLWHHHGHAEEHHGNHAGLAPLVMIGDAVHNFIDGAIIAASFLVSPHLGFTTAAAVFFHELPQEIGDFSIMIYGGWTRRKVMIWNLLGALVSPIGAGLTLLASEWVHGLTLPLLGLAAGNFIYIAAADLIPEIHREKKTGQMFAQVSLLLLGILAIVGVGSLIG